MMYEKKRCCYGFFPTETTLTLMTKLIIGSDVAIILMWLYFSLILLLGSTNSFKNSDWYQPWVDVTAEPPITENMFLEIFAAIMFVLIPLFIMLLLKTKAGYIWWM